MKIWLDDERDPALPIWQRTKNAESDMVWIKDPEEAIRLLKSGIITLISLDHDLGVTLTGYDVAKFIEESSFLGIIPKLNWRVHTENRIGYLNITRALTNANRFWSK